MRAAHEIPADLNPRVRTGWLTWEEYLRIEDPPGLYYEYDEGALIVSPSGRNLHSRILGLLGSLLYEYEERTAGRHCVVFVEQSAFMPEGEREYRPDVAVVTDGRPLPAGGWIPGAPNIAVEVHSERTRERDRTVKAAHYHQQGADELWLFDPDTGSAEFFRRGDGGWQPLEPGEQGFATPLLPGFVLDVADLYRRAHRGLSR